MLVSYIQNFALHFSAFARVSLPYLHCRFRNITLKAASKFREHVCQSPNNRSALSEANHQAFSNFPDKHEEPSVNVRIYGGPIELQAPALQRLPDLLPPHSGAVSLARCFNAGQVSVRMRRSRERSRRRSADRRLKSPESEGRIIATSGGRPDEVIENTGRIDFWRRTGGLPTARSIKYSSFFRHASNCACVIAHTLSATSRLGYGLCSDKKNTICYIYNSTSYNYGAFPIVIPLKTN